MFADAETFGVIPMSEAIPVAIPYAVANALANADDHANANLKAKNVHITCTIH